MQFSRNNKCERLFVITSTLNVDIHKLKFLRKGIGIQPMTEKAVLSRFAF